MSQAQAESSTFSIGSASNVKRPGYGDADLRPRFMINPNHRLALLAAILSTSLSTSLPAQAAEGAALAKTSQCMSCHAVDKKLVGPAFSEVAAKYRSDTTAVDALVGSIKSGSKGKWGGMAMPSNPRLSDADLRALADWVLAQ